MTVFWNSLQRITLKLQVSYGSNVVYTEWIDGTDMAREKEKLEEVLMVKLLDLTKI